MADSVDRVFAHALNTVKRIRSARPPPSDRLKLYGLYKQSMEGDVEGVMDRPMGDGEEACADQDKWDAWSFRKGLSRTEAKRQYISTLIETMHRYASQTPDARELVSELEFVWDQIKSNPPSSSSSHSYPLHPSLPGGSFPTLDAASSIPPPVATNSRRSKADASEPLRVLSPVSQGRIPGVFPEDESEDEEEAKGEELDGGNGPAEPPETPGPEVFVDAPDSLDDDEHDDDHSHLGSEGAGLSPHDSPGAPATPSPAPRPQPQPQQQQQQQQEAPPSRTQQQQAAQRARELQSAAGALIAPFAKYMTTQPSSRSKTSPKAAAGKANEDWQRRIEASLIKLNTELVALREQLEMQHHSSLSSVVLSPRALLHPFRRQRIRSWRGFLRWVLEGLLGSLGKVMRHVLVDTVVVVCVAIWMRWRGVPPERVEELVAGWVRWIRGRTLVRRLEGAVGRLGMPRVRWPVGTWPSAVIFMPLRGRVVA